MAKLELKIHSVLDTSEERFKRNSKVTNRTEICINESDFSDGRTEIALNSDALGIPKTYEEISLVIPKTIFNTDTHEFLCIIKPQDNAYAERISPRNIRRGFFHRFQVKVFGYQDGVCDICVTPILNLKPAWCKGIGPESIREFLAAAHDSNRMAELQRYIQYYYAD